MKKITVNLSDHNSEKHDWMQLLFDFSAGGLGFTADCGDSRGRLRTPLATVCRTDLMAETLPGNVIGLTGFRCPMVRNAARPDETYHFCGSVIAGTVP